MSTIIHNYQLYPNKLIVLIVPTKTERLELHQYFENKYPQMPKTSLRVGQFKSEFYGKCWNCDDLALVEYHTGFEPDNIDEYYSGFCTRCETSYSYEPNFDSDAEHRPYPANNAIVIGDYFKHYMKSCYHQTKEVDSNINLDNYIWFVVDPPSSSLNKTKLGRYIDLCHTKLNTT